MEELLQEGWSLREGVSLRAQFALSGLMLMEDESMHKDAILTGSRDALGDMQGGRLISARSRIEI